MSWRPRHHGRCKIEETQLNMTTRGCSFSIVFEHINTYSIILKYLKNFLPFTCSITLTQLLSSAPCRTRPSSNTPQTAIASGGAPRNHLDTPALGVLPDVAWIHPVMQNHGYHGFHFSAALLVRKHPLQVWIPLTDLCAVHFEHWDTLRMTSLVPSSQHYHYLWRLST